MASLGHLQTRLGRLRATIDQGQDEHIGDRIEEWTRESLFRKLEAFFNLCNSGRSEEDLARYHKMAEAINQDIESRKTEEEKRAEQRYKLKYPCTGAAEALYQKLSLQLEYEKRSRPSCEV